MCENYLISVHDGDILNILKDPDKDKYFSVNINFLELFESDTNLGNALLTDPENSLKNWNEAVFNVQNNLIKEIDKKYTLKNNVNCRIYSLPPWPHVCRTVFPGNDDADKFLQVTGTVVRMSARKLLEYQRQYICTKCKYPITVEAKYDKRNIIKQPKNCTNPEGCAGKNIISFGELDPYNCKDYQEIKIQEDLSKMGVGTVPGHMVVTLEDDLVNVCKPGENVTITGIVKRRWSEFDKGVKITVDIVLKANHVQVNNSSGLSIAVSDDMKQFFDSFWEKYRHDPLVGRNIILKSIAPEIYGRELIKLAIAIVLAGGSSNDETQTLTGIDTRSESHLLLVGDPGTGKSQMLRFASRVTPRSVLTTGVGSTAAGLTVTAIMEDGEWQLEAGALVMADGGICCIDEFNSMREHDRTSIHEAMEQQTISVAKAGIVCKLKTRCSILAACNPKGNIDPSQSLCVNVAMSSPLLSRFDLILLLRDLVNEENDRKMAEYLLNKTCELSGEGVFWSLEKLQAYYAVIKKESPKLTSEAETILSTYYQLQRKFGSRNKSRTTVRFLESLIRLSQGHAKLIYHSEVEVIDTIFAIILVDAALDYESSLLNLKIDYDSFFDNPKELYWDLLETVLGKLNLDYIYQREIEKVGVKFVDNLKKSDNDNLSRNDSCPIVGNSRTVSQNVVTTIPRSNQQLFSQQNSRQKLHDNSNLANAPPRQNEGNSHNTGSSKSQFLFGQRRQKFPENSELINIEEQNQSKSENSNPVSRSITSSQSESKLLFTQRRSNQKPQEESSNGPEGHSKNDSTQSIDRINKDIEERLDLFTNKNRVPRASHQNNSVDSGNITHSSQKFTNIFGQSPSKEKDIYQTTKQEQNFSIFQNKNDSFKRKTVVLNLEKASNSGNTNYFLRASNLNENTSKSSRNIEKRSEFRENNKTELKVGGLEKKNMKLSEIVKSNNFMDSDFDLCFNNLASNISKPAGARFANISEKFQGNASDFDKRDEESGFCSQNRSKENSELKDSILEEPDGSPFEETKKNTPKKKQFEDEVKTDKKGNKRQSNSPKKGEKETKRRCNQSQANNDIDLLNLMPSVNDDFMKYQWNIDWNVDENGGGTSPEDIDKITKREGDSLTHFRENREDILHIDCSGISNKSKPNEVYKITNDNNKNKYFNGDTEKQENKKDNNIEHVENAEKWLIEEKKAKENGNNEKCKEINEMRSNIIEDDEQNKSVKIAADPESDEPDLISSSQNELKPLKKFKFANKRVMHKLPSFLENSISGNQKRTDTEGDNDNELETKKDRTLNFKRLSSNIEFANLDEEIRNFEFAGIIQNPFKRRLSNSSSKSPRTSKCVELEKNNDINGKNNADNKFLSINNFKQNQESEDSQIPDDKVLKIPFKSNFGNLDMDIKNIDLEFPSVYNRKVLGASNINLNENVGEKHDLFDLSQNSKKLFIRNKFTFKKLDIKRMSSSDTSNSDDL